MTDVLTPLGNPEYDEPQRITPEQLAEARERLRLGVDNGYSDPLTMLEPQHREWLRSFAFYEPDEIPVLEREVKGWMAGLRVPERHITRFSLREFTRWATRRERAIREERERRRRLANHNLRVLNGGRSDQSSTGQLSEAGTVRACEGVTEGQTPEQMIEQDSSSVAIAVGHLLFHRRGRIWFDNFYRSYRTDWNGDQDATVIPPSNLSDGMMRRILVWLHLLDPRLGRLTLAMVHIAVAYVADRDERNEPLEWLNSLSWDRVPRLDSLLTAGFGAADTPYHRAAGSNFVKATVARLRNPGCQSDAMLVLYGSQGIGKTRALRVLGGNWYRELHESAATKDFLQTLSGALVGEIAEMDSIAPSRVENSRVKALLSRTVDHYRPPYAHAPRDFQRIIVFVGTTNEDTWHRDETGGRRFWPIRCGHIDEEWLKANRDQLFAEAAKRQADGETWWEVPLEEHAAQIAEHQESSPWAELLRRRLDGEDVYDGDPNQRRIPASNDLDTTDAGRWGNLVTSARVGIQMLGIPRERVQAHARAISAVLRRLGWVSVVRKVGGRNERFWVKIEYSGVQADGPEMPERAATLPF